MPFLRRASPIGWRVRRFGRCEGCPIGVAIRLVPMGTPLQEFMGFWPGKGEIVSEPAPKHPSVALFA
eukprot:11179916-Lingulodinium_polyedra.AAC.1